MANAWWPRNVSRPWALHLNTSRRFCLKPFFLAKLCKKMKTHSETECKNTYDRLPTHEITRIIYSYSWDRVFSFMCFSEIHSHEEIGYEMWSWDLVFRVNRGVWTKKRRFDLGTASPALMPSRPSVVYLRPSEYYWPLYVSRSHRCDFMPNQRGTAPSPFLLLDFCARKKLMVTNVKFVNRFCCHKML